MRDTKQSEVVYGKPFVWWFNNRSYSRSYNVLHCETCANQIEAHIIYRKDGIDSPIDARTFNRKKYCSQECAGQKKTKQKHYQVTLRGKEAAIQTFCFGG